MKLEIETVAATAPRQCWLVWSDGRVDRLDIRARGLRPLTIVGGVRNAPLVWRRARGRQCAPASPVGRGRPAPQLHR
jgi:hypothetical protein